jgi:hypothetical protein
MTELDRLMLNFLSSVNALFNHFKVHFCRFAVGDDSKKKFDNCKATGDIELRIAVWEHLYPRTNPGGRRCETLVKPWEAADEKTRTLHRARVANKT